MRFAKLSRWTGLVLNKSANLLGSANTDWAQIGKPVKLTSKIFTAEQHISTIISFFNELSAFWKAAPQVARVKGRTVCSLHEPYIGHWVVPPLV